MKKYSIIRKIALSFILMTALFMSCEIGLGSSVDTEPPVLSISNPPADAVISSEFALIGSWSDDGEIESVFVTLRNVETNVKYGAYEAEFTEPVEDEELGSWKCVINPKASEFNIPDGNYEATVEIQDKGEHITRVIRNFAIDNTPPVIILERPGSVAGSGSMDIYGRNLTLEGMSADDHDVNLLEVYVYESDDYANLLEKISHINVPPTVSLPVANFEEGVENSYSRIYKSTSILSDSAQTRYCRIVAYDGAVKYPLDGSEPTEEDKKGNSANYYFLKDTLSTSGILTDDCKITDIYKILTGNKAAPYESFMTTLNSNKVQNGAFVINPKNNPTYTVSVSQPLKKDGTDFSNSTNVMYKGSPVTIEVTAGLDNYGMVNVYPYAIECDSYGNPLSGARPIPLGESSGETPVTNYKWTAIISDDVNSAGDRLVNDHCYVVMIEGQDTIGNPVLPKDLAYGFYFDTRANVSIENLSIKINGGEDVINQRPIYLPANNPANINDASTVEVSGSVISTSGTPQIYINVGDVQAALITLTDADQDRSWDAAANNGKYKYNFKTTFNTSVIPAAYNDKELTLSVKLVNGSASKTETCKIFYDFAPPAIGVYNLTPIARKYNPATETGPCDDIEYLNQTVSFDYSVKNEGNQLAKIVSQVYKRAGESWLELPEYYKEFTSDFENITSESLGTIDTASIANNSELKIALSVWDKSGNKNLKEIVYKVDQTTDEPAVLPADPEKSTLRIAKANIKLTTGEEPEANPNKKNYIETGMPLSLVVYDDDGIEEVTVEVETLSPVTKKPGNIKEYAFDVTLPTQANPYEVKVTVKDVNGTVNSYSYIFGVRVITTMPIVTLTKNKTIVSTNPAATEKQIVATLNINSDQPDFTVERKVKLGNVEQPAYSKTFDKDYEENQSGVNKKPLTTESPYITDVIDLTSALESGVYTLEYIVTDAAGKSGTASDTFKVDNKAPVIPKIKVFDPTEKKADGKYENRASYTFKYGDEDSHKATDGTEDWQSGINNVEYSFDNFATAPLPAAGTDGWQATVDFNSWIEGEHTIYVRATDNVGNVSEVKTANFWFDKSAPTARINSYKDKNGATQNLNQTDGNIFYYGYKFELNITASDTNALQEVKLIQTKAGAATPVKINIPLADINKPVTGLPRKNDGSESDDTAADGTYEYQLYVKDVCGKETLSLKQILTVDHEPPKPAEMVWSNTNKYTPAGTSNIALKGATYQFKATAQDNGASGIKEIEYVISRIEGNTETKTEKIRRTFKADEMSNPLTLILGNTSTDTNAELPEGKYEIKVKSTDNAGNWTENEGVIFYVDQKAPEVKANTYNSIGKKTLSDAGNTVTITGPLTESNALASLTVSGGKNPSITHDSTSWTITDTFTADGTDDGTKTYSITAIDIAGNKGTCTATVLIDTVAPSLDTSPSLITRPETDWANNKADTEKSSFRFEGKTGNLTDGETAKSSGFKQIYFIFANENDSAPENKATEAETNGQKSFTLITKDGTWSSLQSFASYPSIFASNNQGKKYLWIKAYDNAGNSNVWQKIEFIYDIAPPSISAFVNGHEQDNTKQNNDFTLTANAIDSWGIASVGLTVNGNAVSPDAAGDGKTWIITKGQFTDGDYDFIFTAIDKAGKQSSVTRKITIDATAPEIDSISIAETPVTSIYVSKDLNFVVTPKTDVSGIKSVSYTTKDYSERTTNDWIDMIYQSSSKNYRASVTLEEGANNVYFRIEDNAGNIRGATDNYKTTPITIDTTPPSNIKIYDANGNEVTVVEIPVKGKDMTGAVPLVYYLTADDIHGIRGMDFGSNKNITEDMVPEASGVGQGKYKVTIPVASQSTGNAYFTVTDKLGNKTNYSSFAFKVDNSVPEVTFTSPAQTQGLNGNIKIEGKVTDHLGAASGSPNDGKVMTIKIEYSKDNATWVTIDSTDTITQGLTNTTESFSVEHSFSSYSKLYNAALGETDAATGTLYVRVTATDEAENAGSNTLTINLDRDKDRPTIVFDSVNLKIGDKTMSSSDYAWLTGTTVISGTVTDDDGIKELWIKSLDSEGTNSGWKQVTNLNKSGAWNYDIQNFYSSVTDAKEKTEKANLPRTLEFRVVDNQNTGTNEYFTSEESSTLHGIYIKGADNTMLGKSSDNTKLYLKVDTLDPSISIDGIHFGEISSGKTVSTEEYSSDFESLTLGGSCRNFQIKFTARDANGIASKQMTVTFDDGTTATLDGDIVASTVSGETDVYFASFKLDLTATGSQKAIDGKNGKLTIYLQAVDNASNDSERIKEMDYDYKKPTITINRPLENVTLSGAVTVSGILEDNTIQTPALYYALSTSDTVSPFANEAAANADSAQPVTTWTGINPSDNISVNQSSTIKGKARPISIKPYYKELMSNLTWFLYLDGGNTQNHDTQLNDFIQNFGIANYEEINTGDNRFDTIINLYLWIKAVDVNGNEAVVTRKIMADPQGMRPTLVVQSPESEDSTDRTITGGTITINGTAEPKGTNVMQYIHVSIDNVEQPVHSTNGSTSWSTKVNAEDGDHTITVWAEDNSGNLSLKTTRYVKVDKYSPEVSSIFFRQRAGNTATGAITASKEYSSSAYISGQWFLEVTATDQTSGDADGNVETLKLLDSAGNEISGTVVSEPSVNNHVATRTLKYALTAAAGANTFGELTYKIQVYDGNSTTTKDITVNYDNKNPVLANPATDINTSVVQNNGFYTFGSKVTEASNASANQSGLNFVAFFFKNGNKIYDVMRNNDAVEVKDGEYVIDADGDGLPWKTYAASKTDDDTITLTAAPSHIYKGGLVKINGVVYMISEVNGNDITISGTLDPEVTVTAADFALAGVVNNTIEESAPQNPTDEEKRSTNPNYFGYYPHPNNDDGDHIIEKVASDGTWQALINSKNIPDGSIDIHYVAFDKAGNYAAGSVTGATVANNQPRIAGAKIYIDYNGNGKFDDKDLHKVTGADGKVTFNKKGEITIYNSSNNTTTSKSVTKKTETKWYFDPEPADEDKETGFEKLPTTLTIGSETAAAFMMKGKTMIVPEIVGGNGEIKYSYKNKSGTMNGSNATAFMTGSTDNSVGEVTNPIVLAVGDLLKAGESTSGSPDKFTFTFTDSTPGTALTAALEIYAGVNLKNTGSPTVKIKPFYWKDLKDNSLYIENLSDYEDDVTYEDIFADTKGHIELEADWKNVPEEKKTDLNSKLSDGDPKVSGIIKIEGTATDSLRIEKLYFDLPGMTLSFDKLENAYCLSTVDDDGLIAGRPFDSTTGVGLELTKNEYTQDGHTIEWTLIWDTSKVTDKAKLNTEVKVYAQNVGTLIQAASGEGDTSADGTTTYKPIVSSAQINNTVIATQTETGAETAYYKMDIVPYIQYLDTTLARKKTGHPSVYGRTASGDYPVYYYSTKFSSGSEGETYNFVGFNIPDGNIAKTVTSGSTSRALEVSFTANGETVTTLNNVNNNNAPYNKQPNGINNNNLNDDVGVKVWNINSKAKTSSKGSLTEVKMHSNGGTLGYAYIHNGGMTYQLDNKESNDAISTFENIDFIFDKNGNKVGVYCGTNYNGNDHAGRMKFTISNWNNNNLDRDEVRTNTIDLESMAYWSSANATTSAPRRFGTPKLASSTNTNKNNIYMLYYDTVYDELKFRAGQDVTASGNGSIINLSTGRNDTSLTKVEKKDVNTAKIIKTATSDIVYYSLAVVSGTANNGNDDKVVAVWVENNNLYYAYCANPLNASPTWKILEVEKLSGKADGVCAIAVDPDKHIHIAAYSSEATGSLTYTYLASYNTLGDTATIVPNANTVYVDRYGTTGEFLTLEFAENSNSGAYVPYIGYYANEMPKYAYMLGNSVTDAQGKPKAGVAGENGTGEGSFYTGNWEQVILPSISPITANDKNNNINIALTRASGVITTTSGPAGTSNPVLGYAISYQGLGYLETAQLK